MRRCPVRGAGPNAFMAITNGPWLTCRLMPAPQAGAVARELGGQAGAQALSALAMRVFLHTAVPR